MPRHAYHRSDAAHCGCLDPMPGRPRHQTPAIQSCPTMQQSHDRLRPALTSTTSPRAAPGDGPLPPRQVLSRQVNAATIVKRLCVRLPTVRVPVSQSLFTQGDVPDAVFYIASGRVHRLITTEKGNERLVAILGADDFCGEECLADLPVHATSALVAETADVVRIDRDTMSRLLHESPAFAEVFTAFLLSHHARTEAALIDHLVGSVEHRLRHVLVTLAKSAEDGCGTAGVITGVKQEILAALVGTTRPRVNYFLNKFRKLGLIEYGGALPRGEIRIVSLLKM